MRYFPTAAAAAEAGFRPCLRCRPECAPGTRANGTQNTVARALRLIGENGLQEGGVEALAEHLGVGSRHLRRLFLRHLGASPTAVAQTRRLQFAKKLIDETSLPMTEIAFAAGFGSLRRFNGVVRAVYQRTPTQIRGLAKQQPIQSKNQYTFRLLFRPPYDWERTLCFLAAEAVPGIAIIENGCFRRSICLNGNCGYFEVSLEPSGHALQVCIQIREPDYLFPIIERIRAMFDLDADWPTIARTLEADPSLACRVKANPGVRVVGCWDGLEATVQAILSQEGSGHESLALCGRIVSRFGEPFCFKAGLTHVFPTAEVLTNAEIEKLGVPRGKAAAIRASARAIHARKISLVKMTDFESFVPALTKLPGIAEKTAQWVAMRMLHEPDAFPTGDRELAAVVGAEPGEGFERRSRAWRPWRAYAAMYLWHFRDAIRSGRRARHGPEQEQGRTLVDVRALADFHRIGGQFS